MAPRWLVCLMLGLASPLVHAQMAPVVAPDSNSEFSDAEDWGPTAPYAPPELPPEKRPPRPFADAVWTSGHWYWDGAEWRFKPGAWVAQLPGYQFVNGYWHQDGSVWRWIPGGWARPGSAEVEIPLSVTEEQLAAREAPPALQVETPPPAPAPNYTWAPGYWYWSGNSWSWVAGTWLEPPRPGLVFVSPRWVRRGPSWHFVGGGWARRGSVRISIPIYRHAGISVRWGHPNHFHHSWRRYPGVHHDWYRFRNWRAHRRPRHHDAGPVWRGRDRHHDSHRDRHHERRERRRERHRDWH